MKNGIDYFCGLNNGTRFSIRMGGGVTVEAVKVGPSCARGKNGDFLTMLDHDEVHILPPPPTLADNVT